MIVFPAKVAQESGPLLPPLRLPLVSDRVLQGAMKTLDFPLGLGVPDPPVDQIDPLLDQIHAPSESTPTHCWCSTTEPHDP